MTLEKNIGLEDSKDYQTIGENLNKKVLLKSLSLKKTRAGKKRLKDYGKVLLAKQLLRALYNNPRERTFKKYFLNTNSMNLVFEQLNSRLDVVLTAMGGASSNKHAKQLINHGKITVNGHVVKERGYLLKDGDIIASAESFLRLKKTGLEVKNLKSEDLNSSYLSLKVASLKPHKIPSFLNLKTPVFANLFINSDLNYGIYYSKNINLNDSSSLTQGSASPSKLNAFTKSVLEFGQITDNAGLGWKNTNVKSIKNLLLELKLAENSKFDSNLVSVNSENDSFDLETLNNKIYEEKVKKIYSILYSLVQAYYSRQH